MDLVQASVRECMFQAEWAEGLLYLTVLRRGEATGEFGSLECSGQNQAQHRTSSLQLPVAAIPSLGEEGRALVLALVYT